MTDEAVDRGIGHLSDPHREVAEHVWGNPGVHFNALGRELDLTPERLEERLAALRDGETLVAETLFGQTHYYPPTYDEWERGAIALLRRETTRDVVLHLLETDSASPADVADEVGIARSTLQWHLDRLLEADIVRKERDGRRVYVSLIHPEETEALLSVVRPNLPEKWVDRTMRLVDHLLER